MQIEIERSGGGASLYFDGSSFARGRRGGPGASAAAAVLISASGQRSTVSQFFRASDSDHAEFEGLILGLRTVIEAKVESIAIYGDSRNVIDAVLRRKTLKKLSLLLLLGEVHELLKECPDWSLRWIPRERNGLADVAARDCIARGGQSKCSAETINELFS